MSETWNDEDVGLVLPWLQAGYNHEGISRKFQGRHSYKSVQRRIQRERDKEPEVWRARIADSLVAPCAGPLVMGAEGGIALFFDPHAPFHDAPFMNAVVALAMEWKIKQAGGGRRPDRSQCVPQVGPPAQAGSRDGDRRGAADHDRPRREL